MKIEAFLLGFVIFSVFLVMGVFLIADVNKNYASQGVNISATKFNKTYNTIDKMYNISQEMKGKTIGVEISEGSVIDTSYKGALSATRLVRDTFSLMGNIINDLAEELGIPSFFITFAMTGLAIAVIFGLIYIILRFTQ